MKQNEATVSQNLGISNLRLSYVIPARMSIKNLPTLEVSFHKALLDYTQEGENNNSCAKSIRENNFQQLSPTDKEASMNKGWYEKKCQDQQRKQKSFMFYCLITLVCIGKF